ncbi:MAG: hypothetical protein GXO35_05770 [Gammaproteobacteria bacterium]|nr:hypothetical protein [Gammaproteobacteria bacterium]
MFQAGLFYVISVLLGFVSSLVWGVVLGVNNLFLTWFAQPTAKLLFIWLRLIGILLRAVTRTFLDPVCQSVGLSLSTIRSKLSLNGRCGTLLADAIRRA